MAQWDPQLYLTFVSERTQPACDLLARLGGTFHSVVDLGCGPGNSTQVLAARWPDADITAVDNDAAMLEKGRELLPKVHWENADIATWAPKAALDLLFTNAALQWVPDHAALFPRLLSFVAPKGWLAVQMPRNYGAPTHTSMRDVAMQGPWRAKLAKALQRLPVQPPEYYYDLLVAKTATLTLWETEYMHVLENAEAIVTWVSATGLRPFLTPLNAFEQSAFTRRYTEAIAKAYPPQADGKVIMPFKRLFILAQKA